MCVKYKNVDLKVKVLDKFKSFLNRFQQILLKEKLHSLYTLYKLFKSVLQLCKFVLEFMSHCAGSLTSQFVAN